MARTHKHAAAARTQRKHVAGTHEVGGFAVGVYGNLNRPGAVVGADAGRHAGGGLDGNVKRGLELRRILLGHGREFQLADTVGRQREADQAAAVFGHEVDRFGSDLFGGDHQIALILAVFVVHENDHAPFPQVFQYLRNGIGHPLPPLGRLRRIRAAREIRGSVHCPRL